MLAESQLTDGLFQEESDALEVFDRIVESSGVFRLHREVPGEYIMPRLGTEDKDARLDRLLIPLPPAIDAGWLWGAVAVEGKRSGKKLGRLATQALDYTRCAWRLERGVPGLELLCSWIFLFPAIFPQGDLGSVLANNRIGCCHIHEGNLLFTCGGTTGIALSRGGVITVHKFPMGNKRGSR
jgi:hypothetical protein